jgi:hypothetical protein
VLAALWPALRRQSWLGFYLAVLLTAQVKPTQALLLAFPLLLGRRQAIAAALVVAGVALPLAINYEAMPGLFHDFTAAIAGQILGQADFGQSITDIAAHAGCPLSAASLAAGLFAAVLAITAFRLRPQLMHPDRMGFAIAWITIAAVIANPRMKDYDICIAATPFTLVALRSIQEGGAARPVFLAGLIGAVLIAKLTLMEFVPFLALTAAWVAGAVYLANGREP